MSSGVPAGAETAFQLVTTKSGRPLSATVGTSGVEGDRFSPVEATARSCLLVQRGAEAGEIVDADIDVAAQQRGDEIRRGAERHHRSH